VKIMTTLAPSVDALSRLRAALDAPEDHAQFVELPAVTYLMIDGLGPPETPAFTDAVHAVYGITYALRQGLRHDGLALDPIAPLEALWRSSTGEVWRPEAPHEWNWTVMIAQPAEVTRDRLRAAREQARARRRTPALDRARLEVFEEGLAGQILHVGPYIAEWPAQARLLSELHAAGYEPVGPHHEIYLETPRSTAEARLRTILRQQIRHA
jgi:hypothetical protein